MSLIPEVTFPERKASYLKTLWQNHPDGFAYVAQMPVEQALVELEKNPGVGRKVSAAALNFSNIYGRAFVADTHVLRVLGRFGFVDSSAGTRQTYEAVMMSAPDMDAHDLFELHWHLKYLGQQICTAKEAACSYCPLSSRCMKRLESGARIVLKPGGQRMASEIAHLREALAKPALAEVAPFMPLGFRQADHTLNGGVRRGALHEVFAPGGHEVTAAGFVTGLALRLAEKKKPLLWIGQSYAAQEHGGLCPIGLFEFGLDPSRLVHLSVAQPKDTLRAAGDALTCASLGAVIIEVTGQPKILDLTASRRLVLACERHGVPAVLSRFGASPQTSAAETRWQVKAAASTMAGENWGQPVFDVSLIRNRNGRLGQWVLAWSCDNGRFEDAKTAFGIVVPEACDRQAQAA